MISKPDKKKIAVTKPTYEVLKDFSRFNGFKLSLVIETLTEILSNDEEFRTRIVDMTKQKQAEDA